MSLVNRLGFIGLGRLVASRASGTKGKVDIRSRRIFEAQKHSTDLYLNLGIQRDFVDSLFTHEKAIFRSRVFEVKESVYRDEMSVSSRNSGEGQADVAL